MFLIWLLGLVTFVISGCAAYSSVYGLAKVFAGAFLYTIIFTSGLEAAKLVIISFLYNHWKKINLVLKSWLILSIIVLMTVTSYGIFGFLSAAYQTDSVDLKITNQQLEQFNEEKSSYEKRLDDINEQIKNVPSTNVRQKIQLIKSLNVEKKDILVKLDTVTKSRDALTADKVKTEVKTGPITFMAKAIGKPVDDTITYLIFLLMLVFDPLAVASTIALNTAIKLRNDELKDNEKMNIPVTEILSPTVDHIAVDESASETVAPIPNMNLDDINNKLNNLTDNLEKNNKKSEIINSIRAQD